MTTLSESHLETIQSLYDRGLYLQAYEESKTLGPLSEWRGAEGRLLAGRLAGNLGSDRLQVVSHWLGYREHPDHDQALCFAARTMLRRWGPYFAIRWMEDHANRDFTSESHRGEWHGMLSVCHAMLRDRKQADANIAKAYEIAPDLPWLAVEHATVLEQTDRYEQAYEVAQQALNNSPSYRPAVQTCAHLLVLLSRQDEAIELIETAIPKLESGAMHCQLGSIFHQAQRYEDAREQYEIGAEKMPLLDKVLGDAWLARIRSDLASACGDPDTALKLLADVPKRYKGHFHEQVEKSLTDRPADAERKLLDVPFIRQHYRTCAPATLSMLSKYWGKDAEHLEIADQICFDGTPYHAERQWAEEAGYKCIEFTIDAKSATELVDRGMPFTLSTVEPGNAHLQAVIGYDTNRQVLLLRDPFYPSVGEILMDSLEERYGAFGPRGMVMFPQDKLHLLDDLELTDQHLWEDAHHVRAALIDHDRDTAVKRLDELKQKDPEATVTLNAELSLADYDNDGGNRDRLVEALIERYPKCPAMIPRRLGCLIEQGRRQDRLDLLKEASESDEASPLLIHRYALELLQDAREYGRASWQLRRLIRRDPRFGDGYETLGSLHWTLGQRDLSTRLYHIAVCIEDKRESSAMNLFMAKRCLHQEEETLDFLRERVEQFGSKDAGPARTLYEAHRIMARADLGFEVLEEAIKALPDDGNLRLYTATELSMFGRAERANELLESARDKCRAQDWRRAAAILAEDSGKLEASREHWQSIIDASPLDLDAVRAWCNVTRRIGGSPEVIAYLTEATERFEHNWDLQQMLYAELAEVDPAKSLELLRKLIELLPNNAWAWRELGIVRIEQSDGEAEAHKAAKQAYHLDPNDAAVYSLIGRVAERQGNVEQATKAFRKAIKLDPDGGYPIAALVNLHDDRESRREALAFTLKQLKTQVTLGQGILAYQALAGRALSPEQLLDELRDYVKARPDLWQAWSALIDQHIQSGDLDGAPAVAEEATDRFPLIPDMWLRRAEAHRVRLERDEQIKCLNEALRIAPDHDGAVQELALQSEYAGDLKSAEEVLRRALDRNPQNAGYHGRLAEVLWNTGNQDDALKHIKECLSLRPDLMWGWGKFMEWSHTTGNPKRPAEFARELTRQRPGESMIWYTLAKVLGDREDFEESLAACNKCIELNPLDAEAYDLLAQINVEAHRFEEAYAACNPPAFKGRPPANLRGRACWIEFHSGNAESAVEKLWALIDEEPTYTWGLQELVNWCGELDDTEGQRRAADLWIAAEPNNHMALSYRGWAKVRISNDPSQTANDKLELRTSAKEDLTRAVMLDPSAGGAADLLFELQLDDKEFDNARDTLERAAGYMDEPTLLSRRVALASTSGAWHDAQKYLRKLCYVDTDNGQAFGYAFEFADDKEVVTPILGECLLLEDTNPLLGEQEVQLQLNKGSWERCIKSIKRMEKKPATWAKAAAYFMNQIGSVGDQRLRPLLQNFYGKNRKRIVQSTDAWNAAIFALAGMNMDGEVLKLFDGWEQRQDLEPWMLCNLSSAMLAKGNLPEAHRVISHALNMPPDHSLTRHLIDLGHIEVVAGDANQTMQYLENINLATLPPTYQFEYYLALAAAEARLDPNRANGQKQAKRTLRKAYRVYPEYKLDKAARKSHGRITSTIAKSGGFFAKLKQVLSIELG
ncbi:MAG: tetratricopeptide repeat protein [Planctomycetota bacterium]